MKLCIIVPVYNDPRVSQAIDSILCQKHHGEVEIIVIDGASTDNTLEVLEKYRGHLSVLVSEPDNGIFDALNKGIRLATGDIVGLLGADDYYNDSYVFSRVIDAMKNTKVDGCYGDLVYVNDKNRVVRYWRSGNYLPIKLYFGWMPPHFTLFLRKSIYDTYGLFYTRYTVAADYDHMLRLLYQHQIRIKYIEDIFIRMTLGGNSNGTLRNIIKGNVESYMAWRKNNLPGGYLVPILKPAQKLIQYIRRPPTPISQGMTSLGA